VNLIKAVAFMIADMATGVEAARLLTYKSAAELDAGRKNTLYASMAKKFAGDHAMQSVSQLAFRSISALLLWWS
jgi:acyl-CoA dehydrogenase